MTLFLFTELVLISEQYHPLFEQTKAIPRCDTTGHT